MGHLTSKLQACQKCEVAGWGAVNQDPKDPIYPRREWLKPTVQNLSPLVEIGLTDLPKSGCAMAHPAHPGTAGHVSGDSMYLQGHRSQKLYCITTVFTTKFNASDVIYIMASWDQWSCRLKLVSMYVSLLCIYLEPNFPFYVLMAFWLNFERTTILWLGQTKYLLTP